MNKFVTENETVKEDKEDIIIDNIKREIKNLSWFKPQIKNANLSQWSSFIKRLYDSILTEEYQRGKIEFKVPLSKVQLFKLKKVATEEENVFTENIEGKCLNIDL